MLTNSSCPLSTAVHDNKLCFLPFNTSHNPQTYLFLSCSGVRDDLTVCMDGTGHSTEQATHGQACIHESHAGGIQKAG